MLCDEIRTVLTPVDRVLERGPISLQRAVFIESGSVDIYLANPLLAGSRHRVLTARSGELIFPIPPARGFALSGFPAPETRISHVDMDAFAQLLDNGVPAAIASAEAWIERVARAFSPIPSDYTIDLTEETTVIPSDVMARPIRGLVWVSVIEGEIRPDLAPHMLLRANELPLPVAAASPGGFVSADDSARVICRSSQTLAETGELSKAFFAYGWRVSHAIEAGIQTFAAQISAQIEQADEQLRFDTLRPFEALLTNDKHAVLANPEDPLASAFRQVAAGNGVSITENILERCHPLMASSADRLLAFARRTRVRLRTIRLGEDWQRRGGQHLIVFRKQDDMPFAALARTGWRQGYDIVRPDGTRGTVLETGPFSEFAYVLQRPLPDEPINSRGLLRFSSRITLPLVIPVLTVALLVGLLGLITPIGMEILFDTVIPSSSQSQLLQLAAGLAGLGIGAALFELVRNFLMLRMTTLVNSDLEGAIWDRILRLPAEFFRRYTAGDLSLRAGAINQMRDTIGGVVLNTLLSSLFSIVSMGLLLYYSWKLALAGLVIVAIQIIVTIFASLAMVDLDRQALATDGRLQSLSLQTLMAISKLKVAAAEGRAFARWAPYFIKRRDIDLRKRRLSTAMDAVGGTISVLSIAVFIWMVGFGGAGIGIAQFVAFNAAYGQFLSAALSLAGVVPALLSLGPLYERAKPILETIPEDQGHKIDPGMLRGEVELNNVVFRYEENGPLILDHVSLRARQGEFIAIVGPSGSGKSTLLRLLLGFAKPVSGSIFFDQHESSSIDMRAVRRQMGVVLQNGHAATGSIMDNILGGAMLAEKDAWAAAKLAGLDDEINQMPMKMHTFAGENGMLLSGGQRQRLLIARAVVKRPRFIVFDEATSALDNHSQQIVSERLSQLEATRIVIAHRLSTITAADRIYVLEAGRIVEEGTFNELMHLDGVFAGLARRQMT